MSVQRCFLWLQTSSASCSQLTMRWTSFSQPADQRSVRLPPSSTRALLPCRWTSPLTSASSRCMARWRRARTARWTSSRARRSRHGLTTTATPWSTSRRSKPRPRQRSLLSRACFDNTRSSQSRKHTNSGRFALHLRRRANRPCKIASAQHEACAHARACPLYCTRRSLGRTVSSSRHCLNHMAHENLSCCVRFVEECARPRVLDSTSCTDAEPAPSLASGPDASSLPFSVSRPSIWRRWSPPQAACLKACCML